MGDTRLDRMRWDVQKALPDHQELKMTPYQQSQGANSVRPVSATSLTPAEWNLILQALSAYQHNSNFRHLYEKIGGATRQYAS